MIQMKPPPSQTSHKPNINGKLPHQPKPQKQHPMKFEKYHISQDIKNNLEKLGFKRPTDIQFKAIPSILKGEDVLAVAQTGTGKTAAFAIPLIDLIHRKKSSKRSLGIKSIIMVPTRELALQIGEVMTKLSKHTKVKTYALHGGIEQDNQLKKLQDGIDILIATPGRMFDLINQGYIRLNSVETLVLDEADHMLDLGFIEDIKYIKKMLTRKHQTLFFSATISPEIKKLAFSQVKTSAIRIQISPKDPITKNVAHYVTHVDMDDKRNFLTQFIKDHPNDKTIIFARTQIRTERLEKHLAKQQIKTTVLHGGKDQQQRIETIKKYKQDQNKILITTDVCARGIDIPNVTYVINYDLPTKAENYIHRIGRTGRGKNKGTAITLCSKEEKPKLEEIQQLLAKQINVIKTTKQDIIAENETQNGQSRLKQILDTHITHKKPKKKKPKKIKKNKRKK